MPVGHFIAGIAAVIWSPVSRQYLLLRRAENKDFAGGAWECVTGRVEQGESFEDALHREVCEELGVAIQVDQILGTTHFYRGLASPANELVGVVYLCSLDNPASITIGPEHSEFRWLPTDQAIVLLSAGDPTTQWARRIIERAEAIRNLLPDQLVDFQRNNGFEFG